MNDESIDPRAYKPDFSPTTMPMPSINPFDGLMGLAAYRAAVDRISRIERARRNPMLRKRGTSGELLFRLTENGNLIRTSQMSSALKKAIKARDNGACVFCAGTQGLEVDHIVRYADGGSNDPSNLRTLCHACHTKRGGLRWPAIEQQSESTSGTTMTSGA